MSDSKKILQLPGGKDGAALVLFDDGDLNVTDDGWRHLTRPHARRLAEALLRYAGPSKKQSQGSKPDVMGNLPSGYPKNDRTFKLAAAAYFKAQESTRKKYDQFLDAWLELDED